MKTKKKQPRKPRSLEHQAAWSHPGGGRHVNRRDKRTAQKARRNQDQEW